MMVLHAHIHMLSVLAQSAPDIASLYGWFKDVVLLFFPFGQTAPVGGLDIPGWLTGAGGVSALLTGLLWAVLIKDPPLLVPWRIHKEALDTIEKLNKQLDRYNRVAEKATDLRHPQQTQPQGAPTLPIPQPSSYRVSARKRGEQE